MFAKIQVKSCIKADLPLLDIGEFALCTDTGELFIGSVEGNIHLCNQDVIGTLENLNTDDQSNIVNAINELIDKLDNQSQSQVTDSEINGNIRVNDQELIVYDETQIVQDIERKANLVHTHTLNDLQDIDPNNKSDGNVLTYDESLGLFVSKPLPAINQISISNLTDVDTTSITPKEGDVLKYELGKWRPGFNTPSPSTFSSSAYVIELSRWNINNNGTNSLQTTEGTNNALLWAKSQG